MRQAIENAEMKVEREEMQERRWWSTLEKAMEVV